MVTDPRTRRICPTCGTRFTTAIPATVYCGNRCRQQAYRARQHFARLRRRTTR